MRDIVKQPEEQIVHRISTNASEEKWALHGSQKWKRPSYHPGISLDLCSRARHADSQLTETSQGRKAAWKSHECFNFLMRLRSSGNKTQPSYTSDSNVTQRCN